MASPRLFADWLSEVGLFFLRPIVLAWMKFEAHRIVTKGPGVDFARRKPYVLLANHSFRLDVVHVPMPFKRTPHIVASRDLLVGVFKTILLTRIARCISTAKGKGDIRAIKMMMQSLKRGYPILIFPEGDISFFGRARSIETSIPRLVKMLKVDLITCRVNGGYHAMPRWATAKRQNRWIEFDYRLAMTADQVAAATPEEIHRVIEDAIAVDHHAWQRKKMLAHPSDGGAEGLEDILYVCPECDAINSMQAKGNLLWCSACNTQGSIDEHGFIHGFRYTDTGEWDEFQKTHRERLAKTSFSSPAELVIHHYGRKTERSLGRVVAEYRDHAIHVTGAATRTFKVSELKNVIVTLRSKLNFEYRGCNYVLRLDHKAMAFLRACQDAY